MACLFGHKWDGCKCSKCGKTRDEQHDWDLCKGVCKRCGAKQAEQHDWDGCKCKRCGKTRDEQHEWESINGKCVEKCSRCGNERDIEHEWTVVGNKRKCSRCGKEILPTHYVAVAISSCKETDTDRFEKSKGYFMNEYKNDPSFSDLNSGKWEYKEKFLTYPTSDFNVMRVVLEWIAEEVGVSAEKLVEENGKRLFVIKTPVPLGPSLWAVAHYFNE